MASELFLIEHDDIEPGGPVGFFRGDSDEVIAARKDDLFYRIHPIREGVIAGKEFFAEKLRGK